VGTRSRFYVSLLASIAAATLVGAQAQDVPPPPIFRGGVSAVRVDVSVTGDHDAPVTDLQAADFELREDGVAQRVETAQLIRLDGTRTSNTDESLEIRSLEHARAEAARDDVRVFVIFLDDYHVAKDQLLTLRVKTALDDLVRRFGPNDLVAIMDPLTPIANLHFTRARADLLARIDAFEGRLGQTYPVRSVIEEDQLLRRDVWELRGAVTLSALESLTTFLGGLREGRKSVLFVSQGPTMGAPDSGNEERLRGVLQAANRGNVTINAFDPRPLGAIRTGATDVDERLAAETGGRAIFNANSPSERLARTIVDASAYYLVGYTPSRELSDGRFHRIDVKVRRRGVRVTARRGYWAPDGKEAGATIVVDPAQKRVAPAVAALVAPPGGRAADVWVGASRGGETWTRLVVAWEHAAGVRPDHATVLDVDRLPDGSKPGMAATPIDTRSINPSEHAEFEVTPGTAAVLRFTLRDLDGSTIDRWDQAVLVPGFDRARLGLSTARVFRARSGTEARHLEAGADAAPVASRRFSRGDHVFVDVQCYAPPGESPHIAATVLSAVGRPLMDVPTSISDDGSVRVRLPLTSLSPDIYVVEIAARTKDAAVEERVAFRLVP
jgi:VWFA-related protein